MPNKKVFQKKYFILFFIYFLGGFHFKVAVFQGETD